MVNGRQCTYHESENDSSFFTPPGGPGFLGCAPFSSVGNFVFVI